MDKLYPSLCELEDRVIYPKVVRWLDDFDWRQRESISQKRKNHDWKPKNAFLTGLAQKARQIRHASELFKERQSHSFQAFLADRHYRANRRRDREESELLAWLIETLFLKPHDLQTQFIRELSLGFQGDLSTEQKGEARVFVVKSCIRLTAIYAQYLSARFAREQAERRRDGRRQSVGYNRR